MNHGSSHFFFSYKPLQAFPYAPHQIIILHLRPYCYPSQEQAGNPEAADSLLSQELDGGGGGSPAADAINPMQLRRDKKLAAKDPQQYCADRCVATGNCEVYEDIYHMSPSRVMEFCTGCVLAEDDDAECPVDMLYDDEDDTSDLRTNGQLRP